MIKKSFIAAISILAAIFSGCSGKGDLGPSLDYIPVLRAYGERWEMIGPDGEILYYDEFKKQPSPVLNGYFIVPDYNGLSVYKATKGYPTLVPGCEELVSAGIMYNNLIPVTHKNERIKLVDTSGKEKLTIMPVDGNEVIAISPTVITSCFVFITENHKIGMMNQSGEVKIPPTHNLIYQMSNDICLVGDYDEQNDTSLLYLMDFNGKEIAKLNETIDICSQFVDGKALVMYGKEAIPGYINTKGEFTKLPQNITSFIDVFKGLASVFNGKEFVFKAYDDKVGLMNIDGEVLIRAKYEQMAPFGDGKYLAYEGDERWVVLNTNGNKEQSFDNYSQIIPIRAWYPNTKFEMIGNEASLAERYSYHSYIQSFIGLYKNGDGFLPIDIEDLLINYYVVSDYKKTPA